MSEFTKPYFDAVAQLTAPTAPFEVETVVVKGTPLQAFKHAEKNLGEFLAAGRHHGDALFLQYQNEVWSYSDFFQAVDQVCGWLVTDRGIIKGDRIAIAMRNRPEWLIAFVATVTVGAVAVPLNSWGKAQELAQGLEDSEACLVFCDSERLAYIRSLNGDLPVVLVDDTQRDDVTCLQPILARSGTKPVATVSVDHHDPAILMFTSGTSGRPKGALLTHFNCCQALMNVEFIGAGTYMTNTEEMTKQLASSITPKTLLAVPLFHISGLLSQALINLRHGRALYMMYKWDISDALRIILDEQITVVMGAPVMLLELLKHPDFTDAHAAHLTNVSAGGAATPERLSELYASKTGTAMSGGGWGMTETMGSGAAFTGRYFTDRPDASGFPSPIVEFDFRDEDGVAVESGEPGEIWVRSSAAIQGYFCGGKVSDEPVSGWMATGDIGYVSHEGLLYICGRVKDLIIRGGENIYPSEVESCLLEYPGCEEVAVVGVQHDTWGEEVGAVIKLEATGTANASAVQQFCKQRLASFKVPEHVVFTDQALPRNTLQKLLKPTIKEHYFG